MHSFIVIANLLLAITCFDINFQKLEEFITKEEKLLQTFENYLTSEEKRISQLKEIHKKFVEQNTIALKNNETILNHPIDVYLVIKRIAVEWKGVMKLLKPNEELMTDLLVDYKTANASQFDFKKAVKGLETITYYFNVNIRSAAKGVIKYVKPSKETKEFRSLTNQSLDSYDCYLMANESYSNQDYKRSKLWLKEAVLTLNKSDNKMMAEFFNEMFYQELVLAQLDKAIESLKNSIELSTKGMKTKNVSSNELSMNSTEKLDNSKVDDELNISNEHVKNNSKQFDREKLDHLCLGFRYASNRTSKHKCFYLNRKNRPHLRLMSVRVEELYKKPDLVLIHNFLSDNEIELMKNKTNSYLSRTTVSNGTGFMVSEQRLAIGSRLGENDHGHKFITNINERVTQITGFKTHDNNSNYFNVIKYNVGGYYDIHPDAQDVNMSLATFRIASWLNYLSDVEAGGATVFPDLNLRVVPERGAALLWYNLYSNGSLDGDTYHTGCPVLYGSKWIATKWVPYLTQPFQCNLDRALRLTFR